MEDNTVTLGASALEEVLTEMELTFAAQGVPTALRLRAMVLAEELFAALRGTEDGAGELSWSFPRSGAVLLEYRYEDGAAPDLRMVQRMNRNPCTDGVNAQFYEGRCAITVR